MVAMKVQPKVKQYNFMVESLDANSFELGELKDFLRKIYQEGASDSLLHNDELQCERESIWAEMSVSK